MQNIPSDILVHIFGYLPGLSLISLSSVCRSFNELVATEKLWKDLMNNIGWQHVFMYQYLANLQTVPGKAAFLACVRPNIRVSITIPPVKTFSWLTSLFGTPPPPKRQVSYIVTPKKSHIKCILLGQSGVGKTSLLTRIVRDTYQAYNTSIGYSLQTMFSAYFRASYDLKKVQIKDPITNALLEVKLEIWVPNNLAKA